MATKEQIERAQKIVKEELHETRTIVDVLREYAWPEVIIVFDTPDDRKRKIRKVMGLFATYILYGESR